MLDGFDAAAAFVVVVVVMVVVVGRPRRCDNFVKEFESNYDASCDDELAM